MKMQQPISLRNENAPPNQLGKMKMHQPINNQDDHALFFYFSLV
jgi:hypothetical protein